MYFKTISYPFPSFYWFLSLKFKKYDFSEDWYLAPFLQFIACVILKMYKPWPHQEEKQMLK